MARFVLTQRLTLRMAFNERMTFYADRGTLVFGFKARQRLDLGAGYDVTDPTGAAGRLLPQGLRPEPAAHDVPPRGRRRTGHRAGAQLPIALVRRVVDLPLPFHFDFRDEATGDFVLSSQKKFGLRDRYLIDVPDPRIDFRLVASVAVALDALLAR